MIAKIERASNCSAWEDEEREEWEMEINSISDLETLYHEAKVKTITSDYFYGLMVNFHDGEMHIVIDDDFLE